MRPTRDERPRERAGLFVYGGMQCTASQCRFGLRSARFTGG